MNPPDVNWLDFGKQYGIPGIVLVALYYILPKFWAWVQMRVTINNQQNDLANAGLGGVTDVVTTLRNQLSDMKNDLTSMRSRVVDMEATLQKAIDDKLSAEQGEAIAKNDLFNLRLYVAKLIAQLRSLGHEPIAAAPEPTEGERK